MRYGTEEREPAENVRVTLRYKGRTYSYVEPLIVGSADYMYREGNYACDCNKSLFIHNYCDVSFAEMPCGDSIELVSLKGTTDAASPRLSGQ